MSSSHLPLPCLIVDPDGITEEGRTVLLDSKGECFTRDIEALGSNKKFALTWQGWILSSDPHNLHTFLSNPETLEKIDLPHFTAVHQVTRQFECALSDKPTNHGCVVVVLHPNETTFWYCYVGGDEWTKHDYDVGTQGWPVAEEKIIMRSLTPCKGKFYFSVSPLDHGVLKFNPHPTTHVMRMKGVPWDVLPNRPGYCARDCYFELDDEHYRFYAYYYEDRRTILSIDLFKMDMARQRWNEVTDIGDRALLWSGYRGGCCSASRFGLEPNSVYWITEDSLMKVFNILQRIQKICDPPKDVLKLSSGAFWLLPSEN